MIKIKRKQGYFSISAVAKMFSVHQQTIRLYEKQGLITPQRSSGNTRLFSEEDIDRLEEIIYLTHNLGINLAGVEMILKLKRQIKKMQKEMNRVFDQTQKSLDEETAAAQDSIQTNVRRLMNIKQGKGNSNTTGPSSTLVTPAAHTQPYEPIDEEIDETKWEIDYEE